MKEWNLIVWTTRHSTISGSGTCFLCPNFLFLKTFVQLVRATHTHARTHTLLTREYSNVYALVNPSLNTSDRLYSKQCVCVVLRVFPYVHVSAVSVRHCLESLCLCECLYIHIVGVCFDIILSHCTVLFKALRTVEQSDRRRTWNVCVSEQ